MRRALALWPRAIKLPESDAGFFLPVFVAVFLLVGFLAIALTPEKSVNELPDGGIADARCGHKTGPECEGCFPVLFGKAENSISAGYERCNIVQLLRNFLVRSVHVRLQQGGHSVDAFLHS